MADVEQLPVPRIGPPSYPGVNHCAQCNAYWPIGGESPMAPDYPAPSGYCLRYPPVPLFGTQFGQPGPGIPKAESYYPIVLAGWWCREWQVAT